MSRAARRALSSPPAPIHPDQARFIRRSNLQEKLPATSPHPTDIEKADRDVVSQVQQHFQDSQDYSSWPLTPAGIAFESTESSGTGRGARVANSALWEALTADPTWTNKLRNSYTGNAPTTIYKGSLSTAPEVSASMDNEPLMGFSDRTAVTPVTPWRLLDGITGDRAQSDRVLSRIPRRNVPHGGGGASVYHLDDLEKEWNRKWLLFRSMNDQFSHPTRQGFSLPIAKQIYHNVGDDPYISGRGGFNTAMHEYIHGILDPVNPSRNFQDWQLDRPAVTDRRWKLGSNSRYLGDDGTEMSNLIFQLKRQVETFNPGMRDVGFDRNTTDNFLDYIKNYEATGSDPIINLPGHMHEGQPAHGFEDSAGKLQEIMDAAGPDGKRDIGDMTYDTGFIQKPNLRTALLS